MKSSDLDDGDDATYKRNVRTMSVILVIFVIFIFGALYLSSILDRPGPLPAATSIDSDLGFSFNLSLNSTATSPAGAILVTYWLNNTSGNTENITASQDWRVSPRNASIYFCGGEPPIVLGFLKGHYNINNYTEGAFLHGYVPCPPTRQYPSPSYFLIQSHSSDGVEALGSSVFHITLRYTIDLSSRSVDETSLAPGTYTVFAEDEWGDLAILNFQVTA